MLIRSLRDTLGSDGHLLETANGGQAGIDAVRSARERNVSFNVVITDLGMPYVDGRKVAAAVKATSPQTRIILLTDWGRQMLDDNEIPPHVDRVLSKPPRLHELRTVLTELTA